MKKDIYILGVGHNTLNIIELALDCGYDVAGLIHYDDSRTGEIFCGYPIVGCFEEFLVPGFAGGRNFALSMGNVSIKGALYSELKGLGGVLPSLVHPSSYISRFAKIGEGVQIQPHCVVEGATEIGHNTTIVVNTVVHHNSVIGCNDLIAGNVVIGAYCSIGDYVEIGQGSVVVSGKVEKIGSRSVLGAGSVLLKSMEENSVYVGNPARFLRHNN